MMKKLVVLWSVISLFTGCRYLSLEGLTGMQDPNQASDVTAFFRSGQTFVTWKEVPLPGVKYRIYRSTMPIESSEQLTAENLLATVNDYTSLNLMASVNRMRFSKIVPPEKYRMETRVNYVIRENEPPLSDDTGLFVYTANRIGPAYYAVTSIINGIENKNVYPVKAGNSLRKRVMERPQRVQAVQQNATDYVHWTDHVGTKFYPAMDSRPGVAYNFRVHAPQGTGPYALIGVLHGGLFQFNTDDSARYAKVDGVESEMAVRVAMDSPIMNPVTSDGKVKEIEGLGIVEEQPISVWYGFNSNFGTGQPLDDGKDVDYTVRRVLWTLDWVAEHFPVDENRVALRGESMGGIGSLQIALLHPERFSAIHAYVPMVSTAEVKQVDPKMKFFHINPPEHIQLHTKKSLPFIMYTAGRADHVVGWPWKPLFAKILEQTRNGYIFYWDAREHVYGADPIFKPYWGEPGGLPVAPLSSFSRKQSYPAIAYVRANSDPGTVNFAVKPEDRPLPDQPGTGDLIGTMNGIIDWERDTIVDKRGRYEITLKILPFAPVDSTMAHITPRRAQNYEPYEKSKVNYSVLDLATNTVLTQGQVVAEENGIVQIPNVPVKKSGTRLIIGK